MVCVSEEDDRTSAAPRSLMGESVLVLCWGGWELGSIRRTRGSVAIHPLSACRMRVVGLYPVEGLAQSSQGQARLVRIVASPLRIAGPTPPLRPRLEIEWRGRRRGNRAVARRWTMNVCDVSLLDL